MTEPPSTPKPVLADRYQVEGELGRGGMATVYLALDLKHDMVLITGAQRLITWRQGRLKAYIDHVAADREYASFPGEGIGGVRHYAHPSSNVVVVDGTGVSIAHAPPPTVMETCRQRPRAGIETGAPCSKYNAYNYCSYKHP